MNPTDTSASQNPGSSTDFVPHIGQGDNARTSTSGDARKPKVPRAAGQALDQAKEKISSAAGQGKDAAAGKIGGYSDRLRATARSAEQEDPNIAHFANTAADRLQQAADYVRDSDFSRIRQDAADIAHRHPVLFMSGMFVGGLVLSYLVKASVQTLREDSNDNSDGANDRFPSASNGLDTSTDQQAISDSFDPAPRTEPQF